MSIQKNPKTNSPKQSKSKSKSNRSRKARNKPAAYISTVRTSFSFKQTKDGATVQFQEIFPIFPSTAGLDIVIPISPTKWIGTRMASFASTYGTFRPIKLSVSYAPVVGTANSGTIASCAIYAGNRLPTVSSKEELVRTLASTAGGMLTAVYNRASVYVRCSTSLSQNSFPTTEISDDDIPMNIIFASNGVSQAYGYAIINGKFSFHNPQIGASPSPIAYNGFVEVQPDKDNDTTKFQLKTPLNVGTGTPVSFNLGEPMRNTTGAVVAPALTTLQGVLTAPNIITVATRFQQVANVFMSIIGRSPNF
ncbi:hypothetical protein 3 [Human tombus-like virus]